MYFQSLTFSGFWQVIPHSMACHNEEQGWQLHIQKQVGAIKKSIPT